VASLTDSKQASKKPEKRTQKVNVFHQRLASLTYSQACSLLGDEGAKLIARGGQAFELDFEQDVFLGGDLYRVRVVDAEVDGGVAIATITLQSNRAKQLQCNCNVCETPCCHVGAALSYLLETKTAFGLSAPPDESVPLEHLTEPELKRRVIADREKRAAEERMKVRSTNPERPWTDYIVTSEQSGRTYRVALRGLGEGQSFCTCPDFRTNRIQICKHILNVQAKVKKRFSSAKLNSPYRRKRTSLSLSYGKQIGLLFNLPYKPYENLVEIVGDSCQRHIVDAEVALAKIAALERAGHDVVIFPDAESFIQRQLVQKRVRQACELIRRDPANDPLRTELLSATLLPYQLDGIAFCAGAGRAILADDMGLGKTIQGIGVAEMLARFAEIRRVLIICPASLKSQWRSEIGRFSGRSTQIVLGGGAERCEQYASDTFFTICNYEQVLRDITAIESTAWDLIILDEGQRIKNWESKTSHVIRQLESPFRLILSGTPLENRLGELFTVARFADENLLGPAYEFFHKHHIVDERGKTLGYRRMDELRETLKPILLRRTRGEVAKQLPERTDEIILIEPSQEQADICFANMKIVAQVLAKKFMTEMDLLRMQKALLLARMACDSTFLIDREEPEYSSKLERLSELLEGLLPDTTRKIVIFSEWRRMLDRIERRLDQYGCDYVRLDGQVPQKKRAEIVSRFQNNPACQVILMTNAGSTGLNLQSANTVINVDLPWNPAVLEQRIARAHRMGQKNPVHVYKLVTAGGTIEERLLTTLASKQDLANAAIDMESDVCEVTMVSGMENLKKQLEVILLPRLPEPVDESQKRRVEQEAEEISMSQKREKISQASGQLISAALALAGELIPSSSEKPVEESVVNDLTQRLSQCVEQDSQGRPRLTITLPDQSALRGLAATLAKLLQG
jgi:hypothetical protein